MKDIFEEMREILELEYISDIHYYENKEKISKIIKQLVFSGKYSEGDIKELVTYINL